MADTPSAPLTHLFRSLTGAVASLLLAACSSTPINTPASEPQAERGDSRIICDSYIVLDMCVRDLLGDGSVDMVYFSDSKEIFMYQHGRREAVAQVMPLHRCAVPLDPAMQATTNRILQRLDLSISEELGIAKELIANYMAAKPTIDACNRRFDGDSKLAQDDFNSDDEDWAIE